MGGGVGEISTLRTVGLGVQFSGVRALDEVTIEIGQREIVGVIGPNGAGKTTLVNVITGFEAPTSGGVELDGRDVTDWSIRRRIRHGLSRTFQSARLFAALTVRENVEVALVAGGTRRFRAQHDAHQLVEFVGLTAYSEAEARTLAHGHQQLLGIARALATRPRFLFMDEPAAGLNDAELAEFARFLTRLRDHHESAVVLIEHNVGLILEVCTRILVLDRGALIAMGSPEAIRGNPEVAAAYLGRDVAG